MEVDSENIINITKNTGRVLRKRKRTSYADRIVKRKIDNSRVSRIRASRRHRSLETPKIDDLSADSHAPRPSTSTGSLGSVVYLGFFRKVPQLITLDENNDSLHDQGQDQRQNLFTEGQNAKPTTYSSEGDIDEEKTSDQVSDNSWNEMRDTNNLLNLLSEMRVGATYNRIETRARTRECKRKITHK